ncbi:MAG: helix-turn-helix transcriptional regulator, partial [Ignavibacteriales bacterium]|nr:helix-turn-helix transcriptional regulator [Ignavibacteriales bacterium]
AKRLELRLLQKEVASKLGVDEMTVCNWEKNHSSPMLHLLAKIIDLLGYDPKTSEAKTLGEKVLQYRKSHGITQKELARRIGVDWRH